ncbi:ATP-dependent helicase [Candidatus Nomurabacteria bacterium]|nr:ATP-dependent helicase [Candidatus Nomurabacteria bacterium]MCB9820760.1 ATP-dependent helicase [Candidatus Nomurabacteria bacterium]
MPTNLDKKFESEKEKLNPAQLKAVEAIEGPVMVVAGPGTGKTQILTFRIANILAKTDTSPENILAITFTESGAANMRSRLSSIIGSAAYRVNIHTFHGFAEHIIKSYPEYFPKIIGSFAISDVDKISLLENIVDKSTLSLLKPFGDKYHYVRYISSSISELKREGISAHKFASLVEKEEKNFDSILDKYHEKGAHKGKMKGVYVDLQKMIEKNKDLSLVYLSYEEELSLAKKYDFEDMLLSLLGALEENENLLMILGENYQYVLVDEHQDSNNAQNSIIEKLLSFHESPNIFVVGDDKQAIFRFQGASIENFYYFKEKYKNATLINLSINYRSSQTILDSASSVLPQEESLKSHNSYEEKPISLYALSSEDVEGYFVASDIKEKIDQGINPEEIAVLYRNNRDSEIFAKYLGKLGIKYKIESDQDLFSQSDVKKFLIILRAIDSFGDNEALAEALHVDVFGLSPLSIHKFIYGASHKKKISFWDVLEDPDKHLKSLNISNAKDMSSILQKFSSWKTFSQNNDLLSTLEVVFKDSGILDDILSSTDSHERLAQISAFFDEAKKIISSKNDASLRDLFRYLETVKEHGLMIKRKNQNNLPGCVRLMTAHKSKGLEFEVVYITKCYSGNWGDKREVNKLKLLPSVYLFTKKDEVDDASNLFDDERRLFYVALTRAKKEVVISYSILSDTGRDLLPSSYVADIDNTLISLKDSKDTEEKYISQFGELVSSKEEVNSSNILDPEFLSYMLDKRGLSATALNNYLTCPWKFFYENLLRIPHAQSKHQVFGSAVHNALEDFFNTVKNEDVGKDYLQKSFTMHLHELSVRKDDIEELESRGVEMLGAWFDNYKDSFHTNVINEYRINGVVLDNKVRLTGVLDKLEFIDDHEVKVVDYKTGYPKTRNDIMGKNKGSDGAYYRQLIFYKLLLNEFAEGKYSMQSGILDFIQPDEKGKFHKEEFIIEDEEVKELKDLIINVVSEIQNAVFAGKNCDDPDCKYCKLKDMIKTS